MDASLVLDIESDDIVLYVMGCQNLLLGEYDV